MIISQIMLAGFVAYWLKNQYDDEKELMQAELARIYEDSRNQVIDSLLFNRVVEPALNDSVTITMMSADRIDTTAHKVVRSTRADTFHTPDDSCSNTIIAIKIPDSSVHKRIGPGASFAFSNRKQDMLIRSVKLFITHSGDSITTQGELPGFFPGIPDTVLFRKVYAAKIAKKNYGIKVTWVSGNDTTLVGASLRAPKNITEPAGASQRVPRKKDRDQSVMHFSSVFQDNLPTVSIQHDFSYLIRQILPQVLFGLILLLLTGSAFFLTNRSLNRQLMLNSLRNDFVSNITHELKTPVSTVKVALEALKTFDKVKDPAITRDYLDMAGQELNRLDQLISKVLDQSMIGEQIQIIQTQPSDLKHLISNTLSTLQPRLTAGNAKVEFEPAEINQPVDVDPLHFQGVLTNLIDNSLKYGTETPEIRIRLWQEQGSAFVEVSDNGPGIPKEFLSRVFDKFFRVPAGDIHTIKGYGLGLSFASLVMKQHQGSISVKNIETGGCAFTLRFPAPTA